MIRQIMMKPRHVPISNPFPGIIRLNERLVAIDKIRESGFSLTKKKILKLQRTRYPSGQTTAETLR
jgi:hypothetical protein